MKARFKPRFAIIGVVAAIALSWFVGRGLAAQIAIMLATLSRLRPDMVAMAALMSILGIALSGVEWWRLLRLMGYKVGYRTALTAYLSAGLAGYLVNSVGPAIGSAVSLRRHGVSPGRATLLTITANALGFCGILVWAPIGIVLLSQTGMDQALPVIGSYGPATVALAQIIAAALMIFVIHSLASVARSPGKLARRLLGEAPVDDDDHPMTLRTRQVLGLIPWSATSWLGGVCALYVILTAMSPGAAPNFGAVVGSAVLASALGSLVFFVPEGLGVSDGTVVVLLTQATGLPVTTCIAAALAVRALDPVTKVSLLGGLALTAHPAVARILDRRTFQKPVVIPSA